MAIVYAEGEIVDGDSECQRLGGRGPLRAANCGTCARMRPSRRSCLRVNSPGGSGLASEVIQRELVLARQAGKPVVVSMGTVAASGGYYISTAADRVFAEPNTITGSIGVFGILPNIKKTGQRQRGDVRRGQDGQVRRAEHGGSRPKTTEELAVIQGYVDDFYGKFIHAGGRWPAT